jgi:hypothetical protein
MHCEKNKLAKNILRTITWEKDTVKVKQDLQCKGLRPHLWLIPNSRRPGKFLKPVASFVLTTSEFDVFCSTIEVV